MMMQTPPQTVSEQPEFTEAEVVQARQELAGVQLGQFGADMKVGLENDGPVTFWLQV